MNGDPNTELLPESVVNDAPSDCEFLHLANRLESLPGPKPDTRRQPAPRSREIPDKIRALLGHALDWLATIKSVIRDIEKSERYLLARVPCNRQAEMLLRTVKLPLENAVDEFNLRMKEGVEGLLERHGRGLAWDRTQPLSAELCAICKRAIERAASKSERLFDAAVRLEAGSADTDMTPATVPDDADGAQEIREQPTHTSEDWINNKEAAQLLTDSLSGLSDGAAKTRITEARISKKIKGKKKDSGHGYLVEKGSVMNFLDKLRDADIDKYYDYTVWDD